MTQFFNLNLYKFFLFFLISFSIIKCDWGDSFEEPLSKTDITRIDDLVSQYEKDIQPKYDEITKIKNEKIKVSSYNVLFNIQYYIFNIRKKNADLAISQLKSIKLNNKKTITFENTIDRVERSILDINRGYLDLSNTIKQSNQVFKEVMYLLKMVLFFIIGIVVLVILCAIGIGICYMKSRKYEEISQEEEKISKSVKILTNNNEKDKNKVEYIGVNDSRNSIKVD